MTVAITACCGMARSSTRSVSFLPLMQALPPPLIALTTRLSMAELIRSGVTTCVDITDQPDITAEAAQEAGLRAYIGKPFNTSRRAVSTGGAMRYEPASEADEQTLLDHNEHSRTGWPGPARDLDLLGATRTAVAHCPTQFARTGTLLEDFARYKSVGVRIGLSTDAAPQCMLSEMRIGAMLAKSRPGAPPSRRRETRS